MRKFIKKILFLAVASCIAWLGIVIYNQLTDGFSLRQMTSSLSGNSQFDIAPLSEEQKAHLQSLFQQPFRYAGKGCQFYAFESADGKYVVKFFKHKHLRPFLWLRSLPLSKRLKQKAEGVITKRFSRINTLFSSCKLAYEVLPQETGLLFIHLNRTPALDTKVTLIDKIGIKHAIELDEYEFVLQKKGTLMKQAFAHVDEREAKAKIQQLIDLVVARCEKGVADQDKAFAQNVAFCEEGGRPIFIDIGQFCSDPQITTPEKEQIEIERRLKSLRLWMTEHYPHHVGYIDEYLGLIS